MMKTKFLLLLTVLLCGATSVWADAPAWLKTGDTWDDATKTLTVNSNPVDDAYKGVTDIEHLVISEGVTSIGTSAFYECSGIASISFPNSLTSIGSSAFYDCSGIASISFPNSLKSIGSMAFYECSGIASISFPNSLKSINNWAFCYCSGLTTITFGTGLTDIGRQAFSGCTGLTSVDIPASVTSIDEGVFGDCSKLSSITVASGNTSYKSVDDVLLTNDGTMLLAYPAGKTAASYDIPSTVTTIGDNAFSAASSLTSVTIPEGVTKIGNSAFDSSGLTSVTIPANVSIILENAFFNCTNLASVTFEGTKLGAFRTSIFSYCSNLASINIPEGVESIQNYAFTGCYGLTSAILPSTLTSIGQYAFSGCSGLTSIDIPAKMSSISDNAFNGCTGMTDVYCYADLATGLTSWNASAAFKNGKATICHVKIGADYSALAATVRATFTDDLVGDAPLKANQGATPGEYWATFFNVANDIKVNADTKVYKAALGPTSVTLTEITDGIINKEQGVILKSTSADIPLVTSASASAEDYSGNELTGVLADVAPASGKTYYTLSRGSDGTGPVGFYQFSGSTLAANKAFFVITTSSPVRAYYGFGEDGGETGIAGLPAETELSGDVWYDLGGRRLEGKPAAKGIYVKNGRKYLVK